MAGPQTSHSHSEVKSSDSWTVAYSQSITRPIISITAIDGQMGQSRGAFVLVLASAQCVYQTNHADTSKQHDTLDEWCLPCNIRYDTHNRKEAEVASVGSTESEEAWARYVQREAGGRVKYVLQLGPLKV